MLILERPKRLSTDIDVIVDPGTDVDFYIEKAGKTFPFLSVEENKRKGVNNIEKRHFRFHFLSPRNGNEISVLLDVVFEKSPYLKLVERPIRNALLLSAREDLKVQVPDKNCILGDKLTAFAPHTTGIPFGRDKELEIIKRLFDCWTLLQEMDDYRTAKKTYSEVSLVEIGYRGLDIAPSDCLKDAIDGCICILGRGSIRPEDHAGFSKGISSLQGHVFGERINGETAVSFASEVMYLAACILTDQDEFVRISDPEPYKDSKPAIQGLKKIAGMRHTKPLAYAFAMRSFELLNANGLYKGGIL